MHTRTGSVVSRRTAITGEPPVHVVMGGTTGVPPASTAAHTPSAWVEYSPAIDEDWDGISIYATLNANNSAGRALYEVAVGAAGSEVVVAGPFMIGSNFSYTDYHKHHFVPLFVPRGSRIAFRFQWSLAFPSTEQPLLVLGVNGRRATEVRQSGGQQLVIGADAANTYGTLVMPVTYGDYAWREITASASFPVRHVTLCFGAGGFGFVNHRVFELGVGAAASEVGIYQCPLNIRRGGISVPVDVPAGSRLVYRYTQQTNEGTTGRLIAHLYG